MAWMTLSVGLRSFPLADVHVGSGRTLEMKGENPSPAGAPLHMGDVPQHALSANTPHHGDQRLGFSGYTDQNQY